MKEWKLLGSFVPKLNYKGHKRGTLKKEIVLLYFRETLEIVMKKFQRRSVKFEGGPSGGAESGAASRRGETRAGTGRGAQRLRISWAAAILIPRPVWSVPPVARDRIPLLTNRRELLWFQLKSDARPRNAQENATLALVRHNYPSDTRKIKIANLP